jgi:DNA polymerase sigma
VGANVGDHQGSWRAVSAVQECGRLVPGHSFWSEFQPSLAKEIEEFVDFISPNSNETKLRKEALSAVVNTIYDLWPDCAVAVYGSFVTGLELPSRFGKLIIASFEKEIFQR